MNHISMEFENINPFLRCSHHDIITLDSHPYELCAYDYRLIYIESGEGVIQIDGIDYNIKPGQILLWLPGKKYKYLPNEDSCFSSYGINFDYTDKFSSTYKNPIIPDIPSKFDNNKTLEIIDFENIPEFNNTISFPNLKIFEKQFKDIYDEYLSHKTLYSIKLRAMLLLLLNDIAVKIITNTKNPEAEYKNQQIVNDILLYIKEHFTESLSNESIGKQFNFHPAHINRLFTKYTGLPLHKYIITFRLNISINLLENTTLSISEIAEKSGFNDVNYFSRCFKKYIGTSPKNFRSF